LGFDSNDPLSTAVRELQQVFPDRSLEIERVDVDASGYLQLTATSSAGERWFTHDDRGLIEQKPLTDSELPLSGKLSNGHLGMWRTLSYRPGRRIVIEASHQGHITVLKGYRRKKSTRATMNHRIAEEAMERGAFQVPRLVRHEHELETIVFDRIEGEPFHLDESAVESCFRIGAKLAVFQQHPRAVELRTFSPRDEIGVIDAWRRKVLAGAGGLPRGWREVRDELDAALDRLLEPELGLCHRDLHDGQFLLVDGRPALLDFDLLCQADVALDPGNLLAHFSLRTLQGFRGADEHSMRACGEALIDGLDRQQDDAFWSRLRFYQASSFLRLALVYRLRPKWSKLSESLVELGKRCLEDQVRIG